MIIRIMGEGQYRLPDENVLAEVNAADAAIEQAVGRDDAAALAAALQQLHDVVVGRGASLPDEELAHSDVIVPATDATVDEVRALLSDEGLVPDTF